MACLCINLALVLFNFIFPVHSLYVSIYLYKTKTFIALWVSANTMECLICK